ncbi:MAG TPA: hypothetical protein VLH40_04480 [Atribacteraceae bacterium]|nr:hypothetical protein [Atribacteraceae bacterium]
MTTIQCQGVHYREINSQVDRLWNDGIREIRLTGVNGQRYLGRALSGEGLVEISGLPGDDLGIFSDGVTIRVRGNAQEGVGNTMNSGKIIVEGDVRDIAGHAMRGGKLWIRGNAGYRLGIHMKAFQDDYPVIVVGGETGDFTGEYMAGGMIAILGIGEYSGPSPVGRFTATGMHGGTMYIRGLFDPVQAGLGIGIAEPTGEEFMELSRYIEEYQRDLDWSLPSLTRDSFVKLFPLTTRPYGRLYAY